MAPKLVFSIHKSVLWCHAISYKTVVCLCSSQFSSYPEVWTRNLTLWKILLARISAFLASLQEQPWHSLLISLPLVFHCLDHPYQGLTGKWCQLEVLFYSTSIALMWFSSLNSTTHTDTLTHPIDLRHYQKSCGKPNPKPNTLLGLLWHSSNGDMTSLVISDSKVHAAHAWLIDKMAVTCK